MVDMDNITQIENSFHLIRTHIPAIINPPKWLPPHTAESNATAIPLSLSRVFHPLPLSVSHVPSPFSFSCLSPASSLCVMYIRSSVYLSIPPSINLIHLNTHRYRIPCCIHPFFFSSSICSLSYKCASSTHMHQNIRKQTYKNKYLYSKAPREWLCDHNRQWILENKR